MIEVDVQNTKEDFLAYQKYHFRKHQLKRVLWAVVGIILITTPYFYINIFDGSWSLTMLFTLAYTGLLIGTLVVIRWLRLKAYKIDPKFFQLQKYKFDDTSVLVEGEAYKSEIQWTYFTKAEETAEYILLYMNGTAASILPKKFFSSPVDLQAFLDLLKTHNLIKN